MFGWSDAKKLAGNLLSLEKGRLKARAKDAVDIAVGILKSPSAPLARAGEAVIENYTAAKIIYEGYQQAGLEGAKANAEQVAAWHNAEEVRKRAALINLIPGVREYKHTKASAAHLARGNYEAAGAHYGHAQTALAEDTATVMAIGGATVSLASKARAALSFESAAAAGAEGFTAGAVEGVQMLQPDITQLMLNNQRGLMWERQLLIDAQATQVDVAAQLSVRSLGTGTRTRLDLIGRDPLTGAIILTEAKASATAPLTPAQVIAFPDIAAKGAVVIGKGKPGYPGGTVISPTTVNVRRP